MEKFILPPDIDANGEYWLLDGQPFEEKDVLRIAIIGYDEDGIPYWGPPTLDAYTGQ